jgi:prevent-host-death family protein
METLNALAVRKKFGTVLDKVWKEQVAIAITRANKPLVVMVPFDEYENMIRDNTREKRLRTAVDRLKKWSGKNKSYLADFDVVKAVREAREKR